MLLYEYFRVRMTNIGSAKLSAYIGGHVGWERWTAGEKTISKEHLTNRLYQGYLDWKPSHKTSLRVGRQFLPNSVGFWQMNGFRFSVKKLGADETVIYAGLAATPWSITNKKEGIIGIEEMLRIWHIRGRFSFITLFERNGEGKGGVGIERMSRAILGSQFDLFSGGVLDVLQPRRQWLYMSARGNIDLIAKQFISGYAFTGIRIPPDIFTNCQAQPLSLEGKNRPLPGRFKVAGFIKHVIVGQEGLGLAIQQFRILDKGHLVAQTLA